MLVYLDNEYRCHARDDGTMTAYESDFFAGKCSTFIEGYRLVPENETWIREDGKEFSGLMIAPWKDAAMLQAVQQGYEDSIKEAAKAYQEGVNSI